MYKDKTIALVANTSWSIHNFRLGLIRHLKSQGFNIVVIAPKDSFTSNLISEGIDYYEIDMKNYGTNPFSEFRLIFQLVRLYQTIRPDLVFHYTIKPNIYGSFAAAYCKIPSIIITTGLGHLFEFKNLFVRWITLFLYRIASYLSKETWFLNTNDRDVFIYKRITNRKKSRVLKSEGINIDWFCPTTDKKFVGAKSFLFAGRILRDKGIIEFVEAAKIIKAKYSNVRFFILGFIDQENPNSIPYSQITTWQNQKIIKYLGETSDVRPFLEKSSCLVFPSYYREGVSRILMEAAAMETPIITSDNVGCREIVDDGVNGYICEGRNIESLVLSMEKFLRLDNADMLVMGKMGRKKMTKEYSENLIFKSYDAAINNFVEKMEFEEKLSEFKH